MNKRYQLVWNESLQAMVPASEMAAARGKKKSARRGSASLAVCALAAAILSVSSQGALAYVAPAGGGASDGGNTSNTSVGYNANAASAAGNATAIGSNTVSTGNATTAIGAGASATGSSTLAIGANAVASSSFTVAVGGNAKATAADSLAFGTDSQATSINSTAVGSQAVASGASGTALGQNATASGGGATALGSRATAAGGDAVAISPWSSAAGYGSIAIGRQSVAGDYYAMALGFGSQAAATASMAFGQNAKATKVNSMAFGMGAQATDVNSMAFGVTSLASGASATAVGANSVASGVGATAVGIAAKANVETGVALGNASVSSTAKGVAGYVPTLNAAADTAAINATTSTKGAASVGDAATGTYRQITGVAAGTANGDAVNVAQLKGVAAIASKGWKVTDGTTAANIGPGGTVAFKSGSNVTVTQSGTDNDGVVNVALNDALTLTDAGSLTVGNTVVNNDGLTIAGGPSVTVNGIDAGSKTISNVAAGEISSTSTEAVNGSQLNDTNTNVTNLTGTINNFAGDQTANNTTINGRGIRYVRTNDTGLLQSDAFATGKASTAVGYNATASADNSVALGANSTTTADLTVPGYNPGTGSVAGVATGEVSVGSAGAERRITNLAAGAADTDAVNVSQLKTVQSAVTSSGWTATDDNGNDAFIANGGQVKFKSGSNVTVTQTGADSAGEVEVALKDTIALTTDGSVTVGNTVVNNNGLTIAGGPSITVNGIDAGSKKITHVAPGEISSTSTDAVNGSQLNDTNTNVTNLTGTINNFAGDQTANNTTINGRGIRYVRTNDAKLGESDASAQGDGATAVGYNATAIGESSLALGREAKANNKGDVALGEGSETDAAVGTSGATIGGVDYAFAGTNPTSTVSVGSVGHERTITNVAAGRLEETSTDAVNGSQLFATNQQVTKNSTDITNIQGDITGIQGDITNLNTKTDNIYNKGTKYFHANSTGDDSQAVGQDAVAIGMGAVATNNNDVALGAGSATGAAHAVSGVAINGVNYTFAGAKPVSVVSVGSKDNERQVTNVAAGEISATSTDAVNGSQLYASNMAIENIVNGGSGVKYFHANSSLADSTASGVNAIAVGPMAQASAENSVAMGNGANASTANSVAIGAGSTTGAVTGTAGATIAGDQYTFAGANPTGTVSVGAQGEERTITNVAAGQLSADSTDAVNGSQLYATNQAVDKLDTRVTGVETTVNNIAGDISNITKGQAGMFQTSADQKAPSPSPTGTNSAAGGANAVASGDNSLAVGNGSQATASNSVAIGNNSVADRANSLSVGSAGAERQITNVAAGTADTDAVNVSQLKSADAGSVKYDTNADGTVNNNSVTLNKGGDPTIIHNVQAGTATSDAVNVGQLTDAINNTQNWSRNYTDQQVNKVSRKASAGTAAAIATANLPQAYQPNQSSAGVAIGNYQGQSAISVGVSTITESGRYIFKASATGSQQNGVGVGVGAGMVW